MQRPFWKYHGAGNDFILFDDRDETFPTTNRELIQALCHRRTGIGSDGLLLIQPSAERDFRMRYFNPDGGEVDMCGNGARCIARLARDLHIVGDRMAFDTMPGVIEAEVIGGEIRLHMTDPRDWRLDRTLDANGRTYAYDFVNSGVEHVVVRVDAVAEVDVPSLGAAIRHHEAFAPRGTNANFVAVTGPDSLDIRTYERGVEGETLACGTGIVAAGLIAARKGWVTAPVRLTCAGGDVLTVDFVPDGDGARQVTLQGPAVYVFHGAVAMPAQGVAGT